MPVKEPDTKRLWSICKALENGHPLQTDNIALTPSVPIDLAIVPSSWWVNPQVPPCAILINSTFTKAPVFF